MRRSIESLKWFAQTIAQSPQRPLAMPSLLQCLAAANACAEEAIVGIGTLGNHTNSRSLVCGMGYLRTPQNLDILNKTNASIYSIIRDAGTICIAPMHAPHHRPQPSTPASSHRNREHGHGSIPQQALHNEMAAQQFFKLIASWSHAQGIALMPTHIAGKKNVWADESSRDNLRRFAHRREERIRFARSGKCLSLHPPTAQWREEHRTAAQR